MHLHSHTDTFSVSHKHAPTCIQSNNHAHKFSRTGIQIHTVRCSHSHLHLHMSFTVLTCRICSHGCMNTDMLTSTLELKHLLTENTLTCPSMYTPIFYMNAHTTLTSSKQLIWYLFPNMLTSIHMVTNKKMHLNTHKHVHQQKYCLNLHVHIFTVVSGPAQIYAYFQTFIH